MRLAILAAAAAALLLPAAASAAPFGELPFISLPEGVSCVRSTGAPGELVAWAPDGARLERATGSGLRTEADVALGRPSGCPVAATRPGGAAVIAVASSGELSAQSIAVAVREPGGALAPAASLPLADRAYAQRLSVAVAPSGAAVVAWVEYAGDAATVRVARRPAGGAFGAPQSLGAVKGGVDAANVEAGIADDGTAIVAWSLRSASFSIPSGPSMPVSAAIGPTGAPFGPAQPIAADSDSSSLAVAPDGRALIAVATDAQVRVAERAPGEAFGPADVVGGGSGGSRAAAAVTLAPDGSAVVAWSIGVYDDLRIVSRTGLGTLGPPVQLVPSHEPDEGSDAVRGVSQSVDGGALPPDDAGIDLRALAAPGGRTVLTWGTARTDGGLRRIAPRVAVVGPDGISASSQVLGGPLRDVSTLTPLLTDAGVPAVAWGDGAGGRLHLAVEGVPEAPPAPAPRVRAGRPLRAALHADEPLVIPVTCSAACDVAATAGRYRSSASLGHAGTLRLVFQGSRIAPPKPAALSVRVASSTPASHAVRTQTIHPVVRRVPDPPLPRILGLTAVRQGSKVVVSWRVDKPDTRLRFFLSALGGDREERTGESVEGTSKAGYRHTFIHATTLGYVRLKVGFEVGYSSRTVTVRIR